MGASCDACKCVVTKSYEHSSWAANFETPKGQRYIYGLQDSDEDLCADRGAELDLSQSESASALQCRCTASGAFCFSEGTYFGNGCIDDAIFNPLSSDAKC